MLFEITKSTSGYAIAAQGLAVEPPSSIGLLESDIEKWLAHQPNLLLPNEQLLVDSGLRRSHRPRKQPSQIVDIPTRSSLTRASQAYLR